MTLQLLISTINNHFFNRNYKPPFTDYLVINQNNDRKNASLNKHKNSFNYQEKGLAKSRNKALKKATADICLLSDDDTVFLDNVDKAIVNTFKENPSADIITFQIQTSQGELFKKYPTTTKWHNWLSLMRVSSIEIAFKRPRIVSAGLQFDEKFGLEAPFPTGEENIFLIDAYKQGLKILYVPIPIVVHPAKNTGNAMNNTQLISAKGAMFYRMFGPFAYILCLLFAIKKHSLSAINLYKFYTLMLRGIVAYKADP